MLDNNCGELQQGVSDVGLTGRNSGFSYFVMMQQGDELVAFPVDSMLTFRPPMR